jgi:hypothetical protein
MLQIDMYSEGPLLHGTKQSSQRQTDKNRKLELKQPFESRGETSIKTSLGFEDE